MKKIELKDFEPPKKDVVYSTDKAYCVRLGNETVNYFSSKKQTLNFLASCNKTLNEILFFLNKQYALVFLEYRRIWAFGDNYYRELAEIEGNFTGINRAFEKSCKVTTYSGNYYAFSNLFYICDTLLEVSNIMLKIYKERNYYSEIRDLKTLNKQIAYTRKDIENIGNQDSKKDFIELF